LAHSTILGLIQKTFQYYTTTVKETEGCSTTSLKYLRKKKEDKLRKQGRHDNPNENNSNSNTTIDDPVLFDVRNENNYVQIVTS
jgi:hypothetical protein